MLGFTVRAAVELEGRECGIWLDVAVAREGQVENGS